MNKKKNNYDFVSLLGHSITRNIYSARYFECRSSSSSSSSRYNAFQSESQFITEYKSGRPFPLLRLNEVQSGRCKRLPLLL